MATYYRPPPAPPKLVKKYPPTYTVPAPRPVTIGPRQQPISYINVPGEGVYQYNPNIQTPPKLPIDMTRSFASQDPRMTLMRNEVGVRIPVPLSRKQKTTKCTKKPTTKRKVVKRTTRAKKR